MNIISKRKIHVVWMKKLYMPKTKFGLFNNYSLSPNGLRVNSQWGPMGYLLVGHEDERSNCFSINLVISPIMDEKNVEI